MGIRAKVFSTAAAIGIATNVAAQVEPTIPTLPTAEDVAAMSADEVKLAHSQLNCPSIAGPFDTSDQLEAYQRTKRDYEEALNKRYNKIDEAAFHQAFNTDMPEYLKNLQSVPELLKNMGVEAEMAAQVITSMQHELTSTYPEATCSLSHTFSPFAEAKNFDLNAILDEYRRASDNDKANIDTMFNQMFGTEGLKFEELLSSINSAAAEAMKNFATEAESDGKITPDEVINMMRLDADMVGDDIGYYENPAINRIAGDVLRRIGATANAENVLTMSREILVTILEQKAYAEYIQKNGNPFEGLLQKPNGIERPLDSINGPH